MTFLPYLPYLIPDRSGPGITTAALPFGPSREGSEKLATGKETTRRNIAKVETVIGTWNVRPVSQAGNVEVLVQEMDQLNWHILGITEMRWKGIDEAVTDDRHKLWFSGNEKKKIHGNGFLVHKNISKTDRIYTS